ncbi:MAG: aminotransferase class V-fold PLP-dependent enzyme [Erysipelotrichaceae bacterium]
MIYLDNAATTYPKPETVYLALDKANRNAFNAGRGEYKESTEAFELIEDTRKKVAGFVGESGDRVVFTSSATESLNMIINGIDLSDNDYVYVSPFEHNAVIRPLKNLQKSINFEIIILPFDQKTWEPLIDEIYNMFVLKKPKAVFISHISNVTGYIVPYEEIFKMSTKYNSINVLDCAQSYGIINPSVTDTNYVIFAGHKSLYASFGIAGFLKLKDDNLKITKAGGTGSNSLNPNMPNIMPYKYEAGSPNIVAIAALNESCSWLLETDVESKEKIIYNFMVSKLREISNIDIYLPSGRAFGVVSFNVHGYMADDVAAILNEEFDICVRSGYHCAPYVHDFIGSRAYNGTIRVSIGAFTTKEDVLQLINAVKDL